MSNRINRTKNKPILVLCLSVSILPICTNLFAKADSPSVTMAEGGAGKPVIFGQFEDAEKIGYDTVEYFISGNAHSYTTEGELKRDGKWHVTESPETADYITRVIVYKPNDMSRFNGTVYAEWLNVSGMADAAPDWTHGHVEVARQGAAYVLVSAQKAGVNTLIKGTTIAPDIAEGDPERYTSLTHPGDSFSYDIFSQVGQAIVDGKLLEGITPENVIALGESQSAGRMTTYVNAVHPLVNVYDGFVVHSRFGTGAAISQSPQANIRVPTTDFRDDIDTPVLVYQSEGDVVNARFETRQKETPDGNFRLWEVAGTAHYDQYGLMIGLHDLGDVDGALQGLEALLNPERAPQPGLMECEQGINAGPMYLTFRAAIHWIRRWTAEGTPPPIAPRLRGGTFMGFLPYLAKDKHGNAKGGIRTPFVDVPLAELSGSGNNKAEGAPFISNFCGLFGKTVPFSPEKLSELYPSKEDFVMQFTAATKKAVRSNFVLEEDAKLLIEAANQLEF